MSVCRGVLDTVRLGGSGVSLFLFIIIQSLVLFWNVLSIGFDLLLVTFLRL